MSNKTENPPRANRRAPESVRIAGKQDSPENTAPHKRLQAARLMARLQVSPPVAFALAGLAYGEVRT